MKFQIAAALLCSTLLSVQAMAGLTEAVQSFEQKDYKNAFAEFSYLSEEGDPTAVYYLAQMYQQGLGVSQDSSKALKLFQLADKGYNIDATVQLGKMLVKGEGIDQDVNLGLQYLKKAAYAGNEDALYELGNIYTEGTGVEKNYIYAFGYYLMGALKGDKRSQTRVARAYLSGRGVPQDYTEALHWYSRAANQGYVLAQKEWAEIREKNPRLRNLLDAYAWYSIIAAYNSDDIGTQAAAKRDEIIVQIKNGKDLEARQAKIRSWRPVPAAESVPADVQKKAIIPIIPGFNDSVTTKAMLETETVLSLDGSLYGVTADMLADAISKNDPSQIEKKVVLAAEDGKLNAYGYYGDILKSRFSNEKEAVTWYEKGAKAGDPYAQYQLGKMYCEGRGVENPDVGLCYGWFLMAEKNATNALKLTVKSALNAVEAEGTIEELKKGREFFKTQSVQEEKEDTQKKSSGFFNLI